MVLAVFDRVSKAMTNGYKMDNKRWNEMDKIKTIFATNKAIL